MASLARLSRIAVGTKYTKEFRMFFKDGETKISPWHGIPIRNPGAAPALVNFVCEIPRGEKAKFEISTKESLNPIAQDEKKGKLRFITYGGVPHHYGALPQTFEDPNVKVYGDLRGDGDPLDVLDLSTKEAQLGDVYEVKVLGALGLIDENECDWKLLSIRSSDPLADKYRDVTDLPEEVVSSIRHWYRVYKVPDGKPENEYIEGGRAFDQASAIKIIEECHHTWAHASLPTKPGN